MYLQHFQHHWNESCDICGVSRSRSRIPLVIIAIALVTLLLLTSLLLTGCADGSDGDNNESQTSQQASSSGDGRIDYASANAWVELMDDLDVSYICWNLSNKDEASALFKTSCDKVSGFTKDNLSDEGRWLMDVLHGERE